ncbi:CapA family protein (plasmid) [Deinococcus sp. KNUC1210]|uniref:CapA family protein n=1 Tax=Deinococcus sp. KNUC1210 TaxID=2917691 RepID=UPI001EF07B47|nr:CapA family protein [Deinococcus sp. KNUC1210]ULH17165.1 CapA family protein [Deinococcus sp. KNUC1210]
MAAWRGGQVGTPIRAFSVLPAALLLTCTAVAAPLLALGGDVSLARGIRADDPLGPVRLALHADAAYANLESPLTSEPGQTRGIDLRAGPERVGALSVFRALGTENNHMQDGGPGGLIQSRRVLAAAGVQPVSRTLHFSEVGGVRVAWIAFFDDGTTLPPLVAIRAGAAGARYVVVGVHWGAEYQPTTPRQRHLAAELARAGATLIVGSGPHVLQGHELIGRTLVLYSLGNLLFDSKFPSARVAAVVRVRLDALHAACAIPTRSRAGRAELADPQEAAYALSRLGLPPC